MPTCVILIKLSVWDQSKFLFLSSRSFYVLPHWQSKLKGHIVFFLSFQVSVSRYSHSNRGHIRKEDIRVHSWKTYTKPMGAVQKKVEEKEGQQEVHGCRLNVHIYLCVCVCARNHCLSDNLKRTWHINSKLGLWIGLGILQKPVVCGPPRSNVKVKMAKTKEVLSEQILKNEINVSRAFVFVITPFLFI